MAPGAPRAAAFVIAAAIPIYYALRGGSYDIVVRQEEAIVVWLVLGLGFGLGLLPRARLPRAALVPLAAIALLAVWMAISLSWSESDERTVAEIARVVHYGGLLLLVWAVVDRSTWSAAAGGLAVGAVLVSGLAVASRLAPDAFPANEVKRFLGTDRLSYPFYYWNAVGAWSAMAIAMALSWSAHARRVVVRAGAAAALPVCGLAVYLTYSRGGAIGSGLAILLVLALGRNRWMAAVHALAGAGGAALAILVVRNHPAIANADGMAGAGEVALALLAGAAGCAAVAMITRAAAGERWRLPQRAGRVATVVATAAAIVVAAVAGGELISRAWDDFSGTEEAQATDAPPRPSNDPAARLTSLSGNRYHEWRSALRAFESEPLEGIGAGSFEYWWNRDDGREYVRDAHSLYLESLAELGVPGVLLVALLLAGLAGGVLLARFAIEGPTETAALVATGAAFAVFLFHAGIDWMWETTAVTALALGGGAVAALGAAGDRSPRGFPLARIGVPIVAVIAMLIQLPGLVSVSQIRDSQDEFRSGQAASASATATDAVEAQPWAASPYVQRALVEEGTGRLSAASVDLRRAVRREPTNWRPRLILARVEAMRGRTRQALASYRTARRLRPRSVFFPNEP